MLTEPPLVGREEELGQLGAFLEKVTAGSGGLVLISGEAGIGKTRLATEFEDQAEERGCKVLFGGCLPSAQIPYLVFLDALNDLFDEAADKKRSDRSSRIKAAAKKAAPEMMKSIPIIGSTMKASAALLLEYQGSGGGKEISKEHVLFRTLDLLKSESSKRPLVMHLDDLQWADSMSIAMLHFLARNCRDLRVLLLGTYRSEEVLNKEAGIHPFLESIRIMKREGLVEEISLKPLGQKHLEQVVTGMLELPVHENVLERIFKESGGSPLFAVETVKLLIGSGALSEKDGRYKIAGSLGDVIPSSVKEVILRRIERTSKDERKALDYASVIGSMFNPELLADALRKDRLLLLENLEHLENDHQLVREFGLDYIFTHEKVRKFTYDRISHLRKKEIHRTMGLLIEKQLPNDSIFPTLALHFDAANDHEKAMKYSFFAAEFFSNNHALNEAIPLYRRVLELGTTTNGYNEIQMDVMEGLGDVYFLSGDVDSAAKQYNHMLEGNVNGHQRVRVLRKLAECWAPFKLGKGDKNKAVDYAKLAMESTDLDDHEVGEIATLLKVFASLESDWVESRKQAQIAEEAFRRAKDEKTLSISLIYNSPLYLTIGELETAKNKIVESENINERFRDMDVKSDICFYKGVLNMHQGNFIDAINNFNECADISEKLGENSQLCIANYYRSIIMSMIGEYEKAVIYAKDSIESAEIIDSNYHRAGANSVLAHAYYHLRNLVDCEKHAIIAYGYIGQYGNMKALYLGMSMLVMAEVSVLKKDWVKANKFYNEAINMFNSCVMCKLMEGMTNLWYGLALIDHSKEIEAKKRLIMAIDIFKLLGNDEQIKRCQMILGGINKIDN